MRRQSPCHSPDGTHFREPQHLQQTTQPIQYRDYAVEEVSLGSEPVGFTRLGPPLAGAAGGDFAFQIITFRLSFQAKRSHEVHKHTIRAGLLCPTLSFRGGGDEESFIPFATAPP